MARETHFIRGLRLPSTEHSSNISSVIFKAGSNQHNASSRLSAPPSACAYLLVDLMMDPRMPCQSDCDERIFYRKLAVISIVYLCSSSESFMTTSQHNDGHQHQHFFQENLNNPRAGAGELTGLDLLHFGEDYRVFINSLSDASVTNESKYRNKKLRRKNKRREV